MNRRFPRQGLRRARVLQEEQAAAALAIANNTRTQAEHAEYSARRQLAGLAFTGASSLPGASSPAATTAWRATVAARASTLARVRDLSDAVEQAASAAEEATDAWVGARRQAAAIGKLDEQHQAHLAVEDLRDEQRVLDEAAIRGSRGGSK